MMYRRLAEEEKRREVNRRAKARSRALERVRRAGIMGEGEKEYVAAVERGAGRDELDRIIERWLPRDGKTLCEVFAEEDGVKG